jgi:lipopolysaccharide transport system permease protein
MTTRPATMQNVRAGSRRPHGAAVSHAAAYLWTHRRLLLRVARTEVASRYAGSILGVGWAVLTPLAILGIYAAIYLVIFPFQPPELTDRQYVLYILCGLAPFLTTAEALTTGVGSIVANRAVLSNVVFPIELLGPKAVLLAQGPIVVGTVMLLVGTAITGTLGATALLVPIVWLLNLGALVGIVWVLSLLNIVLRDLQNLVAAFLMILLIASPFAYTPSMVPDKLQWLVLLNPFAYFVIAYQKLWVLGEVPSLFESVVLVLLGLGGFVIGGWIFPRIKRAFIDYV